MKVDSTYLGELANNHAQGIFMSVHGMIRTHDHRVGSQVPYPIVPHR